MPLVGAFWPGKFFLIRAHAEITKSFHIFLPLAAAEEDFCVIIRFPSKLRPQLCRLLPFYGNFLSAEGGNVHFIAQTRELRRIFSKFSSEDELNIYSFHSSTLCMHFMKMFHRKMGSKDTKNTWHRTTMQRWL